MNELLERRKRFISDEIWFQSFKFNSSRTVSKADFVLV
jgi:hypothetical protein